MAKRPANAFEYRVGLMCSATLMEAVRRGWRMTEWPESVLTHDEVPRPEHRNGYRHDEATGLGIGWDGTTSGCFADIAGHAVGIICGWWYFEDWNPVPGERGFHEWVRYPESRTLVGVMYLPRSPARKS